MSKATTENPTIQQLKGVLKEHLTYEVWMLRSLANILFTDNQGMGVIHNALLESFVIHARIIIEFLYTKKPHKDTVIASQYFASDSFWENIRPEKTELLKTTVEAAHKELAHLTYTRLKGKKRWPYIKIANDIQAVLQVFCEKLPEDFIKEANVLRSLLGCADVENKTPKETP